MELCLPGSGGGVTSRDAMLALPETGGNARWLSSQCPRCIADRSAGGHRVRAPLGVQRLQLEDSPRRVCLGRGRSAAPAPGHSSVNFALLRSVEQDPAERRPRARSHNDHRVEAEAATVAVQRENAHQHEKEKNMSKATRPALVDADAASCRLVTVIPFSWAFAGPIISPGRRCDRNPGPSDCCSNTETYPILWRSFAHNNSYGR
jgi:hypothetical protein